MLHIFFFELLLFYDENKISFIHGQRNIFITFKTQIKISYGFNINILSFKQK